VLKSAENAGTTFVEQRLTKNWDQHHIEADQDWRIYQETTLSHLEPGPAAHERGLQEGRCGVIPSMILRWAMGFGIPGWQLGYKPQESQLQ